MDCTGVAGHLVEAHLVECAACLRTYLALKRASDRAELERPRPAVRARLRAEVARAFPAPASRSRVTVLARRIPLYQGVALAAVAACLALVAPSVVQRVSRPEVASGAPSIDTSRTRAESLHIY